MPWLQQGRFIRSKDDLDAGALPAGLKNADPWERDDICDVAVAFLKVAMNWDGKLCFPT